jgi:DNA-directed RNA polymerase specialized sigma24 family protein
MVLHCFGMRVTSATLQPRKKKMSDFYCRLEEEIPRLRRYARALTRNITQANDLVQDTLTRAIQKEHLWEPGTDLVPGSSQSCTTKV